MATNALGFFGMTSRKGLTKWQNGWKNQGRDGVFRGRSLTEVMFRVQVGELQKKPIKKSSLKYDTLWWRKYDVNFQKGWGLKNRIWYQMDQVIWYVYIYIVTYSHGFRRDPSLVVMACYNFTIQLGSLSVSGSKEAPTFVGGIPTKSYSPIIQDIKKG